MAAAPAAAAGNTAQQEAAVSPSGQPRTAVLGVLGGGQLGRMMALAAANLGVTMRCLDPTPGAPAAVAAAQTVGSFRDADAVAAFAAAGVDVLTVEIEHVDARALAEAARRTGADVEPTPKTIALVQDKYEQKEHFKRAGVPVAEQVDVPDAAALGAAATKLGYPFMLKAKRLAYDGRGNYVIKSPEDLANGAEALGGFSSGGSDGDGSASDAERQRGGLYAEKWAPFVKELAVMVVRDRSGKTVAYPVTETVHRDSILWVSESPADVADSLREEASAVARKAVGALDGAGIFGVEMFLLEDGSLLLNEVAPRPHNSGHYTMDACTTSQFENHVRAVLGWPLGDASLIGRESGSGGGGGGGGAGSGDGTTALMLNLVGEADGDEGARLAHAKMAAAYATPGCNVHWYDKGEGMRKGRKVGHINVVGATRQEARRRLARVDAAALAALEATGGKALAAPSAAPSSSPSSPGGGDRGSRRPLVGIIMGSDSDLPTMSAAAQALDDFRIPYEVTIVSAHRTPDRMLEYARSAPSRGLKVIVAGAGGAAHLPGMVAALTPLPVVGVPVTPVGSHLDGVDALLSICQMPKGVPVATVAIGNAANAGLLAARIVAASDAELLARMVEYQAGMRDVVMDKAERLERDGWKAYLGK
jgi:phosphoribosylaminoimidazole carboxylase